MESRDHRGRGHSVYCVRSTDLPSEIVNKPQFDDALNQCSQYDCKQQSAFLCVHYPPRSTVTTKCNALVAQGTTQTKPHERPSHREKENEKYTARQTTAGVYVTHHAHKSAQSQSQTRATRANKTTKTRDTPTHTHLAEEPKRIHVHLRLRQHRHILG